MKVKVCTDWDAVNSVCLTEAWVDQAVFPELTESQTFELATSIVGVLAMAYIFRRLARVISSKN